MIRPLSFKPFLQIGRYQVSQYDESWLRDAIVSAGQAANHDMDVLVDDLVSGVNHYLEHRCPKRVLKVESLIDRISLMLDQVGLSAVAQELPAAAPPVTIALDELAKEGRYELAFFGTLRNDIEDLREHGVSELRFTGMREAIFALTGAARWSPRCRGMQDELEAFLVAIPNCLANA